MSNYQFSDHPTPRSQSASLGKPAPVSAGSSKSALPLVAAALALAADGLPVFPCNAEKKPIVEHGFYNATRDPDVIRKMFARPGAALIGVPTGRASGWVVIDVDPRHDGHVWFSENKDKIPPTRTHGTMQSGLHLVFRNPSDVEIGNSNGRIAPGVDVRGTGGYVVVPPSAGYSVKHDGAPADMPQWLIGACLKPKPPKPPRSPNSHSPALPPASTYKLRGILRVILSSHEGTRNARTFWAACRLAEMVADQIISRDTALRLATDAAAHVGLSQAEAMRTAQSAFRTIGI
jgi:hypothetical protein